MENTLEQIHKLTKTPNRSTHQLQQIRRADLVIQAQATTLTQATHSTERLSKEYSKLVKNTKEAKAKITRTPADNTDYVLQHGAELVDQQLRVLERTREVLEENKRL